MIATCGVVLLGVGFATLIATQSTAAPSKAGYMAAGSSAGPMQVIFLGAFVLVIAAFSGRRVH